MSILDNIFWHALTGPHARFASGAGGARRYARGFSPILGFENPKQPDFASLAPHVDAGEHFYCAHWTGEAPGGWQVEAEGVMHLMVWDAPPPEDTAGLANNRIVPLDASHAPQALALAQLTQPGPFGIRTPELGEYFGIFDEGELIAMTGERMHAPGLREVSGVCTHPRAQGQGLARLLVNHVVKRQIARGEQPVLHVMRTNTGAHGLYQRMGFRDHHECPVRVVALSTKATKKTFHG